MGNVMPWDMLNPKEPRTPKQLQQKRLAICAECPFFNDLTASCMKCGCFMKLKTKLSRAECPIGKWGSEE